MYIFNLMDYQTAGLSLLFISLMEVIAIGWIYGKTGRAEQTQKQNSGNVEIVEFGQKDTILNINFQDDFKPRHLGNE